MEDSIMKAFPRLRMKRSSWMSLVRNTKFLKNEKNGLLNTLHSTF